MHLLGWTLSILVLILGLLAGTASGAGADSLDDVARRYRMQVYESYRLNRPELDRRLQSGQQILNAWRDRGSPEEEEIRLIHWFRRATWASQSSHSGTLPEYIATDLADGSSASSAPSQVHGASPRPPASPIPAPRRRNSFETSPMHSELGANDSPAQSSPTQPDELLPLEPANFDLERPTANRSMPAERLPNIHLSAVDPGTASDSLEIPSGAAAPVPAAVAATPLESFVAPLPRDDARHQTDVDLEVLTAKIRSVNLSLVAIESELIEATEWKIESLEAIVHDLTRLFDASHLLTLYYDAIPEDQRARIEPPIKPGPIQAMLAQRVFETRIRLVNEARIAPSEALNERLDRLEVVFDIIQRWNRDSRK